MHRTRSAPQSLTRFFIVLAHEDTLEAVVLHATSTADQATLAFHQERHRLIQERVVGELMVVHHDEHTRKLLREPLSLATPSHL